MKKKCIYLCIIIFLVHNFSQVKADNYQTTSPYWSTEKNGPTSKQEAIDMFFKDRTLDPIEGIWMIPDWGMVAITKREDGYVQYVVDIVFEGLNGTQETTYFKTEDPNVFNFFERISWPDGNWYIFKTSTGTLILKDDNLAEITFVEEFAQSIIGGNKIEKIWPITSTTSASLKTEEYKLENLTEDEIEKKLDTLAWYNWDDSKDHTLEFEKANAKIEILESEYYLKKKKDINQYSWWINGHADINERDLLIFGKDYTVFVSYENEGFVSTKDWKSVKPNELINEVMDVQRSLAEEFKETGSDYIENMNWIYKPEIDEENNLVNYSYEIFWNGKEGPYKSMQTMSLVLGRKGFIELSFVKKIDSNADFKEFANFAKDFTKGVKFVEGSKHTDFKSGDKVAALGIGGLVAGTLGVKALAKAGILAKFLPLLAKFWWIIIAPIVAIFGFAGKKNSSGVSGADKESISRRKKRRK